ncbi:small subunit ribosomal protein S3 [Thermonema lapsum]|uniref:Small ribosomal subunit protein uS3 n=1 Tax=Thermonema lapsum TaxID=28195 RepID=A0A846MTE0_9BACT|nr:30S ribosomal protein S3 [Thermonema lapsum]NIK74570.1 small subunit ribosomal protein S3 [Thermonema lapsum]
MGQKVNPIGLRLGIIKGWESNWYADKRDFKDKLYEDYQIRQYIEARVPKGSISKIAIERTLKRVTITIHTARPGVIIGKGGAEVDKLREELKKLTGKDVQLNIFEIKRPELDARLVAESIAQQLRARVSYRRAMKQAIEAAMRVGAEGIKIRLSGRLGGAEMARSEEYKEGRVPLHTLRADIDYALAEALTTYGLIGVKVWIFKGEVYEKPDFYNLGEEKKQRKRGGGATEGRARRARRRKRNN